MSDHIPPDAPDDAAHAGAAEAVGPPPSEVEVGEREAGGAPTRPPLRRLDLIVLAIILVVSGAVHFIRLAEPGRALAPTEQSCRTYPPTGDRCYELIPLDEVHYVPDARDVVRFGTESDTRVPAGDGAFVVHPPVSKWFIALGIVVFGDEPFGWRVGAALFGTLGSLFLWLIALRLWRSPWLAAFAASLLALDGLWFVMSRIAMLDIFPAVFVLAGIWMLLEDRDRPALRGPRWWRIAAGLTFGLAIASKWAALPFIAVAGMAAIAWELRRPPDRRVRRLAGFAGSLALLPIVVYVATFIPWFVDDHRYNPPRCESMGSTWLSENAIVETATGWLASAGRFGQWVCYQREMYDFLANERKYTAARAAVDDADATTGTDAPPSDDGETDATVMREPRHPYYGNAWAWPWIGRPVAHYFETLPDGRVRHILGLPNPVIWFVGFAALPLLLWWAVRRDAVAALLLLFALAGWIPYLNGDRTGHGIFLFYATPLVPFLVLALTHVAARMRARRPRVTSRLLAGYVAVAVAAFAYFYPVLAAVPMPRDGAFGWERHMWLRADCNVERQIKNACWI